MTDYRVRLSFPPSVNTAFATRTMHNRSRRYPTRKYLAWRREAIRLLRMEKWPLITDRVAISLVLTAPDRRRRDADNYTKAVIDALVEAGVIADDSSHYVSCVLASWAPVGSDKGVLIQISTTGNLHQATDQEATQ